VVSPRPARADGLPVALDSPDRLAAVAATGLLDTGPEAAFDDLASLAATLTGCRRAYITLVDDRRSFWKSCFGVDAPTIPERQSPVGESFCYLLVGAGGPFVVDDAAHDPRTAAHPSVVPMKIGAWAGYPILAPAGEILGSMCVVDENPHGWAPAELATLATLARAVSNEINLRASLTAARALLEASKTLARSLQNSLLPPVLQPVPGLEVAASYLPAGGGTTVVGDFYDLFQVRGPWWCTVIGDVCGKGVEAAKVTALARYTVRAVATAKHLSPAAVCRRLNGALLDQNTGERFLTAAHVTFRPAAHSMSGRICTAGHPPGLIRRADGRVQPVGRAGTLLGLFPDADLELADVRFRLGPGDTLLLYTDGATEARAAEADDAGARALFGEEAFSAALAGCHGLTAAGIVERLGQTLAQHSGARASDDTALLALRVPPLPPADR
jgi:serine phosphatase RsbU (regulator of sigma subunit)